MKKAYQSSTYEPQCQLVDEAHCLCLTEYHLETFFRIPHVLVVTGLLERGAREQLPLLSDVSCTKER